MRKRSWMVLVSGVVAALLAAVPTKALAQLDSSWTITIAGQTVQANPDGTFRIPNVSVPDSFGLGGPGTPPDFIGDDFVRLEGTKLTPGGTQYVYSAPFRVLGRQNTLIGNLVFTSTAPPFPVSIRITGPSSPLSPGGTFQLITIGTLRDGSTLDLSNTEDFTSYRTSNTGVALVDNTGLVSAIAPGTAFITAINNGATAVVRVIVATSDRTTVVGTVVRQSDNAPVAGAAVRILDQDITSTTNISGQFSIPNVATTLGPITVAAELTGVGAGQSPPTNPVVGGTTNVGTIVLIPPTNEGSDFLVVFQSNYDNSYNGTTNACTLFISGDDPTSGTVDIPGISYTQGFSVTPGLVSQVTLPAAAAVTVNDSIISRGVRVHANRAVNLYGLNRIQFTTDAFTAFPLNSLGTRYRVMCYTGLGSTRNASQFAVAATVDNTAVTITPKATVGTHTANVPFTITLNANQVFQLQAASGDLTGSLIDATQPVAAFSGHGCANVPTGFGFCDHLCEQMPPTNTWGNQVLTLPLATRLNGDTFRILADQDATNVQIVGPTPVTLTLNAGQFSERILRGNNQIIADKPIMVCQYSNGTGYDGVTSDPFMTLVPPAEQFLNRYTFATPGSGFSINYVNVIAKTADVAAGIVFLDSVPMSQALFQVISGSDYSCAKVPISVGSHTMNAANPFGIYVYGFAQADSYGYPGGMQLRPRQPVRSLPNGGGIRITNPHRPGTPPGSPPPELRTTGPTGVPAHGPLIASVSEIPLTTNASSMPTKHADSSTSTASGDATVLFEAKPVAETAGVANDAALKLPDTATTGTLGGKQTRWLAVNSLGQAAGWSETATLERHATMWPYADAAHPRLLDLNDTLASGDAWVLLEATEIADDGRICGSGTLRGRPASFCLTLQQRTRGDIDGDSDVTLADLQALIARMGTTNSACDLNNDGAVDLADLAELAGLLNVSPP